MRTDGNMDAAVSYEPNSYGQWKEKPSAKEPPRHLDFHWKKPSLPKTRPIRHGMKDNETQFPTMVSCEEIRGTFLHKLKFLVIKLYKIVA